MRLPGSYFLQNLVERRDLLYQLVRRDFERRFVGSFGGWMWGLVHPLVLLVSWVFVFQLCFRVQPTSPLAQNYPLYLFSAQLPWMLFSDSVLRAAPSFVENRNFITKTVFPVESIPVSIFLSSAIQHAMGMVVLLLAMVFWEGRISMWLPMLAPAFALLALFSVGMGWIVASLHVFLRDTAQLVSVVMTFWFWFTPIFIEESMVPENLRFLLRLNPMAHFVGIYRQCVLGTAAPNLEQFGLAAASAVGVFVLGGLVFRRLRPGFADVL
ncbi:MAG: ABC transporter permease [Bryobacterales bacterium]|jgi:ABC-type polysaccharide/polyol phosphate export permease|nr:ABC transporter permease [Bryobacterales bacterium]